MELIPTLTIIYWIGYAIVFASVLVASAWTFANDKELKEEGQGFDIFDVLLALVIFPTLSWIFIIFIAFAYYFQIKKSKG